MTDIRRTILWVIFGFTLVLLWDKWQVYNGRHATFFPEGQAAIKNVTVEVDCNLGPIGFSTGKTEGVIVTIPGGPVFAPTNLGPTTPFTGVTVFTVGHGAQED